MTLPVSGSISMSAVRTELNSSGAISFNDPSVRIIAGKTTASSAVVLPTDFYGKSSYSAVVLTPDLILDQAVKITPTRPVGVNGGNAPYTFSISPALPPGLIYSGSTGEFTRAASIPTTAKTRYTVTIVDAQSKSTSGSFDLTVKQGKPGTTFTNPSFEDGPLGGDATNGWTIPGWKIFTKVVRMNGVDNILGWPTPTDTTGPANGVVNARLDNFNVYYEFSNDIPPSGGTRCLRLYSLGTTLDRFGIIHGPYAISDQSITVKDGDEAEFYWKAEGGGDAYNIYAYFLDTATGRIIELLNATGLGAASTTPWARASKVFTAADAGTYTFVFVSGTFDVTGGYYLGASLYIDGISVLRTAPL